MLAARNKKFGKKDKMLRKFLFNVIVYLKSFIDHILLNKKRPRVELSYDSQPTKRSKLNDEKTHAKLSFASVVKIIESGDSYHLRDAFLAGSISNVNMTDEYGRFSLLEKAVDRGKTDCVRVLLEHGAVIDTPHRASGALYLATTNQQIDVVKLLLKHGADPNLGQNKPLNAACSKGDLELVEILMEHGAKLQIPSGNDKNTELVEASKGDNLQLVEYLISKGADVNYANGKNSAITAACEYSSVEMVELLLNCGADVNLVTSTGDTGLIVACERDEAVLVRVLVGRGADMIMYNRGGSSPFLTAYENENLEMVDLFLERGIDLNRITIRWEHDNGELENEFISPLMCICEHGDINMIKRLLAYGADVNMMYQYRRDGCYYTHTAVISALESEDSNVLRLLLKEGADANLTDNHGDTAVLHLLRRAWVTHSVNKHQRYYHRPEPIWVQGVQIMLEHGLDINMTNKLGETVFDYVKAGSELDKLLCEVYADSRPALK